MYEQKSHRRNQKSALEQPAQYNDTTHLQAPLPHGGAVLDSDLVILIAEDSPYGLSDLKLASVVQEMKLPHEIVINKHNHKTPLSIHGQKRTASKLAQEFL